MFTKPKLPAAIRMAILGLSPAVLAPGLAFAQSEPTASEPIEEVVVTGTRLKKTNLVSAAPVTQIDAEELSFQGTMRVEDMLKTIPSIYADQGTGQSNGATGTATIELRGLGPERTLVLVNGRRLPAGSPISGGVGADINQIPAALIRSTEVLTGGASAAYGSDAIAGVVNFLMKDDFEGVELDVKGSFYQHDNDSSRWGNILDESGIAGPSGSSSIGDSTEVSFIVGGNLDDGRGNVTAYATWRDINEALGSDLDYSACAHSDTSDSCVGSGTIAEGRVTDFENYDYMVNGNQFVDRNGTTYNYGALNYFQRPDERVTAGAFAHYDVTDQLTVYSEIMYMDDRTISQIAPSGNFFATEEIYCGNPLLSDQQVDAICTQYGFGADEYAPAYISKRNVEGGNRQQDLRHTSHRFVFGAEGDLDDTWSYDTYYMFSEVSMENTYLNDLSNTRLARALDVRTDPTTGEAACLSAIGVPGVVSAWDTDCVPWNIFTTGGVTQEALDYLILPLFARGTTEQEVFSAYMTADLGNYGIQLPSAETGVSVAFGYEYRKESLDYSPDYGFQSGDGAGQGGASNPVSGSYEIKEYFIEANIPLVEGVAFAESVALDLSYRFSDYDYGIDTDTYGIAGTWSVDNSLRFRGSYQKAIRAANIRELYLPQGLNLENMTDVCAGALDAAGLTVSGGRSLEECALSGVTAAQFGSIPENPAGQYNYLQGGNTELAPEEAETITLGVVWTPEMVDGLTLTLDYYNIEIEQGINNLTPELILNSCLDGDETQCANIRRGANGDLWIGSNVETSGYITALQDNLSIEEVAGYDLIVEYDMDLSGLGSLNFTNILGYIDTWEIQELSSAPKIDCAGGFGDICDDPKIDLKNNLRTTWTTPWGITASVLWRYLGEVDDLNGNDMDLKAINYFDFSGIWSPTDNFDVTVGVNNIFDKAPPIAGGYPGPSDNANGNTFPGVYDALGRYIFAGVKMHF